MTVSVGAGAVEGGCHPITASSERLGVCGINALRSAAYSGVAEVTEVQ